MGRSHLLPEGLRRTDPREGELERKVLDDEPAEHDANVQEDALHGVEAHEVRELLVADDEEEHGEEDEERRELVAVVRLGGRRLFAAGARQRKVSERDAGNHNEELCNPGALRAKNCTQTPPRPPFRARGLGFPLSHGTLGARKVSLRATAKHEERCAEPLSNLCAAPRTCSSGPNTVMSHDIAG